MKGEPKGEEGQPAQGRPAIHPVRRRTADRRDWALVTRRRFAAERVDEPEFAGHVALLLIDAVTAPFVGPRSGLRLADAGYAWLSHFPDGARHVVTTMIDARGRVVQWYVDVCREHGLGPDGVPWWDDLYLDLVVRPTPLLLVLDEPTASLDAPSEHALFERYAGAARRSAAANGGITVLVSHRFSTVRMADLILAIEGGRVAAWGTHAELMAAGGLYAELYELQARAYRDGDNAPAPPPAGT